MTKTSLLLALVLGASAQADEGQVIRVVTDEAGSRLEVDGQPLMLRGMNWDYFPVGTNYTYSLWERPEAEIKAALDNEMGLLRAMHVNVIRVYSGMPARWITYVYQRFGIYTVLNHTVGRYGMTIDNVWRPILDYSDPRTREVLKAEVGALVDAFKGTPGLLMWLLGNENNYGLEWENAAIANLPKAQKQDARAEALYSLFGEVIDEVKRRDPAHPIAMANGDLQFIDLIAKHCKGLDVMGANVYRGRSAGKLFQDVHDKLGLPFVFTEFGVDAYNSKEQREDELTQAEVLREQWREIDLQSAGKGQVGNAIGGFTFQWSDGWWKYLQDARLDVHDATAAWANGGYPEDFVEGENNMNEERRVLRAAEGLRARPVPRRGDRHGGAAALGGHRRACRCPRSRCRPQHRRLERAADPAEDGAPHRHGGGDLDLHHRRPAPERSSPRHDAVRPHAVGLPRRRGAAHRVDSRQGRHELPGERGHQPHRRDLLRAAGPADLQGLPGRD
jgi:hypothetical protein